jgi:hypothetical protein
LIMVNAANYSIERLRVRSRVDCPACGAEVKDRERRVV